MNGTFAEFGIQLVGPTLALTTGGAMVAVVRTRTNTQRIEVLEQSMTKLETLPTDIAKLEVAVKARETIESEAFKRNEIDHQDIKISLRESRSEMKRLRQELLDEIRLMCPVAAPNLRGLAPKEDPG